MLPYLLLLLLAASLPLGHAKLLPHRQLAKEEPGFDLAQSLDRYELHDFSLDAQHHGRELGDELRYDLEVLGRRVTLDLKRHTELFRPGYKHYVMGRGDEVVREEPALDCLYHGTQQGEDGGAHRVLAHLCDAHGRITVHVMHPSDDSKSFSISPVEGDPALSLVYLHRDLKSDSGTCGVDDAFLDKYVAKQKNHAKQPSTSIRAARAVSGSSVKHAGIAVVNDYQRYLHKGASTHSHTVFIMAAVATYFDLLGTVSVPSDYNVSLTLVSMHTFSAGDPWTHDAGAACADRLDCYNVPASNGEVSADDLLYATNTWAQNTQVLPEPTGTGFANVGYDTVHLFSAYQFVGTTAGLAHTRGMCGFVRSAISEAITGRSDVVLINIATHEIGHNMGMVCEVCFVCDLFVLNQVQDLPSY
jgi:hypothetical protein